MHGTVFCSFPVYFDQHFLIRTPNYTRNVRLKSHLRLSVTLFGLFIVSHINMMIARIAPLLLAILIVVAEIAHHPFIDSSSLTWLAPTQIAKIDRDIGTHCFQRIHIFIFLQTNVAETVMHTFFLITDVVLIFLKHFWSAAIPKQLELVTENLLNYVVYIINRPGVAGAVLQSFLLLIH